MTERERFEKYAQEIKIDVARMSTYPSASYQGMRANEHWQTWQAAIAAREPVKPSDEEYEIADRAFFRASQKEEDRHD